MYQIQRRQDQFLYLDATEDQSAYLPLTHSVHLVVPDFEQAQSSEFFDEKVVAEPDFGESLLEICRRRKAKSASILVSDATRDVPTHTVLPSIIRTLSAAGIPSEAIYVVIALGVHRFATNEEIAHILSKLNDEEKRAIRVINHDAFDSERLITLALTSSGNPICVNKIAYQQDIHITIGKVEPHEFAGFSGGRKSVLPGIASAACIEENHSPDNLLLPTCVPGNLENNPIHLEMLEFAKAYRIDFSVQFLLDQNGNAFKIVSGEHPQTHEHAVELLRERIRVKVPEFDVLVTTPGKPLNIDFYQAIKPLIALYPVLKSDSILVLYADCPEGVNSRDMLLGFNSGSTIEEALQHTVSDYSIQKDHVLLLGKVLQLGVKILVYSPHVTDEEIRSMFMTPCRSLQEGIDMACNLSGKTDPRIVFCPQAQKYLLT